MNITPMIDVLLVLLVIFMAALPLTQRGLDVVLPQDVQNPSSVPVIIDDIVVEMNGAREVAINSQPVPVADLPARLRAVFDQRRDKTLFVIGAPTLRYGDIVTIIDAAKGAGVQRVGIVTDGMRRAAG